MKIKNKLAISIGLLFVVIILLGLTAVGNIRNMKQDTENILADNYNSVKYAQQMQQALNSYTKNNGSLDLFKENLELQAKNITEPLERQATEQLINYLVEFERNPSTANITALSEAINNVILLNITAISDKAQVANKTATGAQVFIVILAAICAMVAALMFIVLPRLFSRPIKELTDGIIEVSKGNYDNRLNFSSNSEFGEVSASFNSMAHQLAIFKSSSISKILATKRYLETIINSINDPIIGLDPNKTVIFANNAATNILNMPLSGLVGFSALDISLNNDLFRRLVRGLEKSDELTTDPLKIYSDNKESYFQVHYLASTDYSGTVMMLSNITQYKELDNAKTNFISVISHELKTPISAILMSLKLLEDKRVGSMNDEQLSLAQSIRDSSDRLLSITGELLKMTQVEAGCLQLSPKVTKPIEIIDYAVNATRVLADKFGCNVEIDYPAKLPKLFVDSEKIAWVITNLLSNAIHHSSEHSRVIIGAYQRDSAIEIFVQDFGKGIDARYHQTIFDRYFRVPGTKVQGSGLGLAISKDFLEAHGGSIRVDSEVGKGSRFTATLNLP